MEGAICPNTLIRKRAFGLVSSPTIAFSDKEPWFCAAKGHLFARRGGLSFTYIPYIFNCVLHFFVERPPVSLICIIHTVFLVLRTSVSLPGISPLLLVLEKQTQNTLIIV